MLQAHVCIVTPGHLSTNPRVVKEAAALQGAGYAVTIICGDYLPGTATLDAQIAHPDWTVRRVPFGPHIAATSDYVRQSVGRKAARVIFRAGLNSSLIECAAHAPIACDLASEACTIPADLYIAHYVAALPACARAARLHGTRYAFDAEDFHLGDLPETSKHAMETALVRSIERRWLPGAAYRTAASPLIANAYSEAYGIAPPRVVLNAFPLDRAPSAPSRRGTAVPGPSLYWVSQTIGPNRGLEMALEAVSIAKTNPHLHLRGTPAAGFRNHLTSFATSLGVADRLHFHEPLPPAELERAGAIFDIGLCSEPGHTANNKIALSNKLFGFLLAGVPPLLSNTPGQVAFARASGLNDLVYPINDKVALAALMDHCLEDEERLFALRTRVWELGRTRYNWDIEQEGFLEEIARVFGARVGIAK